MWTTYNFVIKKRDNPDETELSKAVENRCISCGYFWGRFVDMLRTFPSRIKTEFIKIRKVMNKNTKEKISPETIHNVDNFINTGCGKLDNFEKKNCHFDGSVV